MLDCGAPRLGWQPRYVICHPSSPSSAYSLTDPCKLAGLQYLRWYIDDQFVYEVNKNALLARTNSSGAAVGQRLIPQEAVYIILNLGMSEDFGRVDYDNLAFPSQMLVDYIRWVRGGLELRDRGELNVRSSPGRA